MKTVQKIALVVCLITMSISSKASVVELTKGSLDALKGVSSVNIQYDYSALTVNGYPTIDEYITFKKKKFEEFHKGAKKGDEWYTNWLIDRTDVMQPRMEEVMNRKMEKCGMIAKKDPAAKYTLIVKITHYLESNAGFPYFIGYLSMFEAKVYLVETAAPDVKLATIRADYLNEIGDLGGSIGNLICKYIK